MPSATHEGIIDLFRQKPAFMARILREVLHVDLPPFGWIDFSEATVSKSAMTCHADALVLFHETYGGIKQVYASVLEVQLATNSRKRYSWPLYAVSARARHECPCALLTVTTDPKTQRWASQAIALGGGNVFRPIALGPANMPQVTDREHAMRDPQLAVLSAVIHSKAVVSTAVLISRAAIQSVIPLSEEPRLLYSGLIQDSLSPTVRKVLSMEPQLTKFFSETQRRFHNQGKAETLLEILRERGLAVTIKQQHRIVSCTDAAVLQRWVSLALTVASTSELLAPRPPAKPANGHATKAKRPATRKARPAR